MKSIYITGIAGMLGSNLAYLMRGKYKIFGVDRNKVSISGVNSYTFSVLEIEKLKKQLIESKIEILIHCAALANVDKCEINPEYANNINFQITSELCKICDELEIKLIFISTDAVFNGEKKGLYNESDKTDPKSVYGKTKLEAENEVLSFKNNLVVRTNIYGFNYREKKSFGEWIVVSLINNIELKMFNDIYFSPILVNDLADILVKCIEQDVCGLYHICSTDSISKYDLAILIRSEFNLRGVINQISMDSFSFKAPRTKNMGLCNAKIKELLGISLRTPAESVKEFKRLYVEGYPARLKGGDKR
jgi:dTDP-4-dehydrorhamnose reductase